MAKKAEVVSEVETEVEVVVDTKPAEILTDFGRHDLNAVRDAVNWLLRR